jgi:hypothetical protein
VERFGWTFCPGDKVMQVENNYHRDVYNGDLERWRLPFVIRRPVPLVEASGVANPHTKRQLRRAVACRRIVAGRRDSARFDMLVLVNVESPFLGLSQCLPPSNLPAEQALLGAFARQQQGL